jgi:hypothetical protein
MEVLTKDDQNVVVVRQLQLIASLVISILIQTIEAQEES